MSNLNPALEHLPIGYTKLLRAITITDVEIAEIIEEHGTTATIIAQNLCMDSGFVKQLARSGKAKRDAINAA